MGNKLTRRRPIVDERYTQPQGLYEHDDVNHRKLRRLILNGQLAPCYPGVEELAIELDECPICFLFYPSLNRSKCCSKGICTECFLQIKSPHTPRSVQCPFCKMPNYAVEYRGAKTVEEKGVEQAEEQRVIEAKIRIRQKELLDEEQRILKREEDRHDDIAFQDQSEEVSLSGGDAPDARAGTASEAETAMHCHTAQTPGPYIRFNREDDFDMDLEDIMLMEAIWLSVQEPSPPNQDSFPNGSGTSGLLGSLGSEMRDNQSVDSDSSASNQAQILGATRSAGRRSIRGGLAGAIAALAERQVIGNESQSGQPTWNQTEREQNVTIANEHSRSCGSTESPPRNGGEVTSIGSRPHAQSSTIGDVHHELNELNNWIEVSVESGRATSLSLTRGESRGSMSEWVLDQSSEAVEVGTSFSSSVPSTSELPWEAPELHVAEPPLLPSSMQMLPESFEEQMMLAMALSLAEAQAQSRRHSK